MIAIIIAVVVISLIGAVLAALLTISQHFFTRYGPCNIDINQKQQITIQGGSSVLDAMFDEKIFIPSACGGRGTCGLCKLKILEGGGDLLPTEEPYLDKEEMQSNIRLACQVKIRNDMKIEIAPELFNVREYLCKCIEICDLTYDIKKFRLKLIEPEQIDFIPGQYIQLLTPVYEQNDEEVYRAYSISSDSAEKNFIDLIIRLVPNGICTTYCFNYLKVGDEIKVNGPYGDFRFSDTQAPAVFVAGGSGMAPIVSILDHMKNNNIRRKSVYYFGGNKVDDLFLIDQMKQHEKDLLDFRFVPVVAESDNQWKGQKGLVTQAVQSDLKNAALSEAYLCGSPGMIDASIKVLKDLGMREENIFYDKFE